MSPSLSLHQIETFIERCPHAALVTLHPDGRPHVARVEVAMVDGRVRSTGASGLVRVRNVRRDSRCSLFIVDEHPWWIGLEGNGSLIDGPAAGPELLRLLRRRHPETPLGMANAHDDETGTDRLLTETDYLAHVEAAELLVVDFEIRRAYGNVPGP